jgi:flagellar hook-length control protein FliK
LKNEQAAIDMQEQEDVGEDQPNVEGLLDLLHSLPGMEERLAAMLPAHDGEQGDSESTAGLTNVQPKPVIVNATSLQQQLDAIFKQAKEIIGKIENGHNLPKAAVSLLKLLEQWTTLTKKLPDNQVLETLLPGKHSEETSEQAIWRELVKSFQKRNQFVANQQYKGDAKVTRHDVTKWLQHVLTDQTRADSVSPQQPPTAASMPMSKVEQYVVYINQSQGSQTVDQQLIEKFQQVMKSSKFLAPNNGTSQLSISLKPENLGEMMVKLTKINGEMMVKIMVASQAAKDMLESNMHQLKNMFSPHQVVIEKQEMNATQTQQFQGKQEDQSMDDSKQEQSHQRGEDETNQRANDDFQSQFHELLLNEKV